MSRYELKHNFGYGQNLEVINKLKLTDVNEVKEYIENVIPDILLASYDGEVITFLEDGEMVKLQVKKL